MMSSLAPATFAVPPESPADGLPTISDINKKLAPLLPSVVAKEPEPSAPEGQPPRMNAIAGKMSLVVGDLAMKETGTPVQVKEKAVVEDLDTLIAALEKACANCKGNMSRNNPSKPANASTIRRGTGGVGDLTDPGQSQKDWAKLSTRERDRILQSMSEGFPPEYRQVLERYYRRLAEEKTIKPGASGEAVQDKGADPLN
jgi:hypothetical protein